MFYHKLKDKFELLKKHYSEEEIIKNRKKLLEEFANPDDFDLPQPEIIIKEQDNKKYYKFITNFTKNGINTKVETIIIEENDDSYISFKVDDSISRKSKRDLETTILIYTIVSLNYLNYFGISELVDKNNRINMIFETNHDNMASVDMFLAELFNLSTLTFKRGERKYE